jgi:hypothetical protein
MHHLTATATALVLAANPVFAQDTMAPRDGAAMDAPMTGEMDWAQMIRTRDITGGPVYTTNEAWDEGSWTTDATGWGRSAHDTVGADWNDIGEIEDIVLDRSGQLVGIVAEIGGFLDIGDRHVMLQVGYVQLVPVDDRSYSLVTRYSEEELEQFPEVDEGWWN